MISATVKYSTGFVKDPDTYEQVPSYNVVEGAQIQVQALTGKDLAQLQGLNLQGVVRAIYLYGDTQGVNRPSQKGGDLIIFDSQTWLTVTVLETWPGWSKVAATLQMDP
ncbi:hypothetical protein CAL28_10680 [Bordetella genomosp. 11]|uniref:Uncharacterized protein n=2 Tax=Bordetella genomosp. 11 TaxID=1416808 RepID=A0A261UNR9_9BORD|nr:hypothetical protein CAL28_10680 [Bordetella genomosp. 11]